MEPIIAQLKAAQRELEQAVETMAQGLNLFPRASAPITKVAVAHFRVRQAIEDLERVNKVVSAL